MLPSSPLEAVRPVLGERPVLGAGLDLRQYPMLESTPMKSGRSRGHGQLTTTSFENM